MWSKSIAGSLSRLIVVRHGGEGPYPCAPTGGLAAPIGTLSWKVPNRGVREATFSWKVRGSWRGRYRRWVPQDPLAPLLDLPDVAPAFDAARAAVDAALRHRALRRSGGEVAAEVGLRSAVASAALEGHGYDREAVRDGLVTDPVVQGALRATAALDGLTGTWERAPRQVLAKLHTLIARDVVPASSLGRPVGPASPLDRPPTRPVPPGRPAGAGSPGRPAGAGSPAGPASPVGPGSSVGPASQVVTGSSVGSGSLAEAGSPAGLRRPAGAEEAPGRPLAPATAARLDALARLIAGGTSAPVLLRAAVVHGELLALRAFDGPNGVLARAAGRLALIAGGLDPRGLLAVDVGHLAREPEYVGAAGAFATGTPDGVRSWLKHYAAAVELAAAELVDIAEAVAARG